MTPPLHPGPEADDDPWQDQRQRAVSSPSETTWVRKTRGLVVGHWSPQPVPLPRVDSDLPRFSALERSAEVFRYTFHKTEYWLSPGGGLREWIRFNLRVAVLLVVPSVLVVPLVTYTLGQFSIWTDLLAATTSKMVLFPLSALLVIGLVCGLVYLGKAFQHRPRGRPGQYYSE